MKNKVVIVALLLISSLEVFAQLTDKEIRAIDNQIKVREQELERVKKELKQFRKKLESERLKERDLLSKLADTEKEIMIIQKVLRELREGQKRCEIEIQRSRLVINELKYKIDKLKENFAKRVVYLYKNGRTHDLSLILSSNSINQAIYRYKYLNILAEIDRRNINEIKDNITKLDKRKIVLEKELEQREKIIKEKERYQNRIRKIKRSRERQLAQARRNKKYLASKVKEKEKAIKELQNLIADLEKERDKRQKEIDRQREIAGVREKEPFYSMKGSLIWPVEGEIIGRFGLHKHPRLKTITENPGIDIRARKGAPVRAVLDGVVTTITYIRGYGNTIIIDHGSGFYTVYTHVDEVYVAEGQYIRIGTVIASVGDTGSLEGALLHFEVWKNKTKLNPEEWLARKT